MNVANPPNFEARVAEAKFYVVWRAEDGQLVVKGSGNNAPTPEALSLLQRIEFADAMVSNRSVVNAEADRTNYRLQLLSYAMTGLEYGNISTAQAALSWFENEVTEQQGPQIRRRHVVTTLVMASFIGIPSLMLALALPHWVQWQVGSFASDYRVELTLMIATLWLLVGNALGVTFFAFSRNLELQFDQLSRLDPARLEPWLRFVLVAVTTAIFGTFLVVGVVQFGLGGTLLNDFVGMKTPDKTVDVKPLLCVLVGILAGYADSTVISTLTGTFKSGGQRQ